MLAMPHEVPLSRLRPREEALHSRQDTSASSARIAMLALGIPDQVEGQFIADLAAGACSLTAFLLDEKKANAHAVDILYRDDTQLETAISQSLVKVLAMAGAHRDHMFNVTTTTAEQFRQSRQMYPDHYHAAWLTELPFADNTADLTVSFNGITLLHSEPDLMLKATLEALRITKPGQSVVMAPYLTIHGRAGPHTQAHKTLHNILQGRGYRCQVHQPTTPYLDSRLRIIGAT